MFKSYEFQGGKHRRNAAAHAWRAATSQAAVSIRAAHPEMVGSMVQVHAELQVSNAFRLANRSTGGI